MHRISLVNLSQDLQELCVYVVLSWRILPSTVPLTSRRIPPGVGCLDGILWGPVIPNLRRYDWMSKDYFALEVPICLEGLVYSPCH